MSLFHSVSWVIICLSMVRYYTKIEIFILQHAPDMLKKQKSEKSNIEKFYRCDFRFLAITFLFRKIQSHVWYQITPLLEGFRTIYRKYGVSKNEFWDKNPVKWGMDLVLDL